MATGYAARTLLIGITPSGPRERIPSTRCSEKILRYRHEYTRAFLFFPLGMRSGAHLCAQQQLAIIGYRCVPPFSRVIGASSLMRICSFPVCATPQNWSQRQGRLAKSHDRTVKFQIPPQLELDSHTWIQRSPGESVWTATRGLITRSTSKLTETATNKFARSPGIIKVYSSAV